MLIGGLQKTTLIDYPGKLACTVFISGCNFYCPWCYNPELVLPELIKKQLHPHTKRGYVALGDKFSRANPRYGVGARIPKKEFFEFLKTKQGLLDGVVICGGEPTLQKDLPEFIKKIKKLGYLVKLDTNGSNPEMLKSLIAQKLIDYVAMDIKAPLGRNFQFSISNFQKNIECQISKYTKEIEKSVKILKNSGIDFEFRTTVVNTVHTKEDILEIAKWIGGPNVKYYLQNFRPEKTIDSKFEKIKPYSEEYFLGIKKEISQFFRVCEIR